MLQIRTVQRVRVEKDRYGLVKSNAVLVRVSPGLQRIPLEHLFSIYVIAGDAVRRVAAALDTAPTDSAGWLISIEPFLGVARGDTHAAWTPVLNRLRERAR